MACFLCLVFLFPSRHVLSGRSSMPMSGVLLWGLSIKLYPHHMIWQPEAGKVGVSCEAPLTGHSHVFSTMISGRLAGRLDPGSHGSLH